jgi:hypothetical protein
MNLVVLSKGSQVCIGWPIVAQILARPVFEGPDGCGAGLAASDWASASMALGEAREKSLPPRMTRLAVRATEQKSRLESY